MQTRTCHIPEARLGLSYEKQLERIAQSAAASDQLLRHLPSKERLGLPPLRKSPSPAQQGLQRRVDLSGPEVAHAQPSLEQREKLQQTYQLGTTAPTGRSLLEQLHPNPQRVVAKVLASKRQEGGDHYTKLKIQPMHYSMANGLDPMQHTVVKYVTRFRDKGGIADLRKAIHTLELLIEHEEAQAASK